MIEGPPAELLRYTRRATHAFVERVVPALRREVQLSSWYRAPSHNRSVGGHPDSQHLLGLAVDVVGSRWAMEAFAAAARSQGLVAVEEGTHVHVQLFPAGWIRHQGYGWLFDV